MTFHSNFLAKERIFTSRDFIQQEVFLGKAGSFSQKADSQLNHKTPQLCRDVITNSYCVNVMRLSYDLYQPIIMKKGRNIFYYKFYLQSLLRKFAF